MNKCVDEKKTTEKTLRSLLEKEEQKAIPLNITTPT